MTEAWNERHLREVALRCLGNHCLPVNRLYRQCLRSDRLFMNALKLLHADGEHRQPRAVLRFREWLVTQPAFRVVRRNNKGTHFVAKANSTDSLDPALIESTLREAGGRLDASDLASRVSQSAVLRHKKVSLRQLTHGLPFVQYLESKTAFIVRRSDDRHILVELA